MELNMEDVVQVLFVLAVVIRAFAELIRAIKSKSKKR